MGRGVFLGIGRAPTTRGRCPSSRQFGGSLLFMHTSPFVAKLPNLTWQHIWERDGAWI